MGSGRATIRIQSVSDHGFNAASYTLTVASPCKCRAEPTRSRSTTRVMILELWIRHAITNFFRQPILKILTSLSLMAHRTKQGFAFGCRIGIYRGTSRSRRTLREIIERRRPEVIMMHRSIVRTALEIPQLIVSATVDNIPFVIGQYSKWQSSLWVITSKFFSLRWRPGKLETTEVTTMTRLGYLDCTKILLGGSEICPPTQGYHLHDPVGDTR